jgi:hypothetical protein
MRVATERVLSQSARADDEGIRLRVRYQAADGFAAEELVRLLSPRRSFSAGCFRVAPTAAATLPAALPSFFAAVVIMPPADCCGSFSVPLSTI